MQDEMLVYALGGARFTNDRSISSRDDICFLMLLG